MYLVIRKYSGARDLDELERSVVRGFLPVIRNAEGFLDYYFIRTADDAFTTVSVFENRQEAEASIGLAAEWIKQNAMPLLPTPPEVSTGEVVMAAHRNLQPEFLASPPETPAMAPPH